MLNQYIKDLMEDMEIELIFNENEDVEFSEYLKTCTPYEEEIQDKLLKENWNLTKCGRCNQQIDILSCSFIDGITPVCKNGCNNV